MNSVDQYIQQFPAEVQEILNRIRKVVLAAAPDAVESMAYGMPAYKTGNRPLIYFAAFKNHIGLYALPGGHHHFANALSMYKGGKGSVQFPLNRAIPYQLIGEIVAYRVEENSKNSK